MPVFSSLKNVSFFASCVFFSSSHFWVTFPVSTRYWRTCLVCSLCADPGLDTSHFSSTYRRLAAAHFLPLKLLLPRPLVTWVAPFKRQVIIWALFIIPVGWPLPLIQISLLMSGKPLGPSFSFHLAVISPDYSLGFHSDVCSLSVASLFSLSPLIFSLSAISLHDSDHCQGFFPFFVSFGCWLLGPMFARCLWVTHSYLRFRMSKTESSSSPLRSSHPGFPGQKPGCPLCPFCVLCLLYPVRHQTAKSASQIHVWYAPHHRPSPQPLS